MASTYSFIKANCLATKEDVILEFVKRIDKNNSTHQSSEGPNGGNKGCEHTAEFICKTDSFYERLRHGEACLVNELAKAIPTRYTLSFASKYCAYVSRYMFDLDEYSIYDQVLCNILPYYAWVYLGKNYTENNASIIAKKYGKKGNGDYKGYRDLIDCIRAKSEKATGYYIRREDFDHLLWYYFKGDKDVLDNDGKNYIYKSKTRQALDLVGNTESILF